MGDCEGEYTDSSIVTEGDRTTCCPTMIKLLQINIGECRAAHDLLLTAAIRLEANIIIVSEPKYIIEHSASDLIIGTSMHLDGLLLQLMAAR